MKKLIIFILSIMFLSTVSAGIEDLNTKDKVKIIGCINQRTLETRQPNGEGNCLYGYGWQNIMLPPSSHRQKREKVFKSDWEILNRLPIVNFESGFNPKAGNKFAKGYIQTLRRWNISPDVVPQLEWMNSRQEAQKQGNCSHWWKYGADRVMRCLYARHYGASSGYHWYPNKLMEAREYYIKYYLNYK